MTVKGRPVGSKNTPQRGIPKMAKLMKELNELKGARDQLLLERRENLKKNDLIDKLTSENKQLAQQLKISERPKYLNYSNLTLNEEIIRDSCSIVRNGVFELTQIASWLGISYETYQNWVSIGKKPNTPEDDPRAILARSIEYNKQIFFMINQQPINKSAQAGNIADCKWNIQTRFKHYAPNTNQQNIIINPDEGRTIQAVNPETNRLMNVKKQISLIISQSVEGEEDLLELPEGEIIENG